MVPRTEAAPAGQPCSNDTAAGLSRASGLADTKLLYQRLSHRRLWLLDENSAAGNGFSAELCRHWEACVDNLPCRTVIARLGVVLDRDRKQGALAKMRPAFALGLGTRFGSGQQWQAYIHRRDVVEALCFFIDREECRGVYNLVSPEPVRNQEFSQQLARALHRPLFLQMPQAVAALLFGEMQELFFSSQRVVPAALASSGYPFQFSSMEAILHDCVERP